MLFVREQKFLVSSAGPDASIDRMAINLGGSPYTLDQNHCMSVTWYCRATDEAAVAEAVCRDGGECRARVRLPD